IVIRVHWCRPMRKEEITSWDGGKSTWEGRVRVFGTVPVCVGVQEKSGMEILLEPSSNKLLVDDDHLVHNEPDDFESAENHNDTSETQVTSGDNSISKAEPSPKIISPSAKINHDTPALQENWAIDKHILLVNILGKPWAGLTTRSRVRDDSEVASTHECLYVNFLYKIEPKKVTKALK
nr:hypothetical protein [Tanacetum cinerariifolium]